MIGLSTTVPTSDGPVRADTLLPGMEIFNKSGETITITEMVYLESPEVVDVYFVGTGALTTSLNQTIKTRSQSQRARQQPFTLTTISEIKDKLVNKNGVKQQEVEIVQAIPYTKRELLVHPYLLGVLLGDGMLDYSRVIISSPEEDMMVRLQEFVPDGYVVSKDRADYQWSILRPKGVRDSILVKHLRDIGVYGSKSFDKHVPFDYQVSSIEDRLHILQGLMDTDGWTGKGRKGSRSQFYTTSLDLAVAVTELVDSLGGVCTIRLREYNYDDKPKSGKRHNHPMIVVELKTPTQYPPHWLPRKLANYNPPPILKHVSAIKPVPTEPLVEIITDSVDKSIVVGMSHVIYHR